MNKHFGVHGEKGVISKALIPLGEATGRMDALSKIYQYNKEIKEAAKQFNVDPSFMSAIIYEEQAHLLPGEEWNDAKGSGTSIGLSQVGVGELIKQGFFPEVHNGFSDYPRRVMEYMKSPELKDVLDNKFPFPVPEITIPPMGS